MACDWQKVLVDALVPAEVAVEVSKSYGSPRIFQYAFRTESALDKFVKSLVVKLKLVTEDDEAGAEVHPAVGALRAYWAGLLEQTKGAGTTGSKVENGIAPLSLALPASSKTHAGDRGRMHQQFLKDYPGSVLSDRLLPSLQFLHTISQQCSMRAWEWIPWRRIVSEEQALRQKEKRGAGKQLDLVDVIAQVHGLSGDCLDAEVGPSPFKLQALLTVRAVAFAFCDCGHYSLWMKYVEAFVNAYTRTPPDGFRPPSVAEAEEADRHVLLEIFRLMFKGQGVDEAISSVICDRDAFRSLLVCVPRIVKQREVEVVKRKRKGGEIDLRPNKTSKESGDGLRAAKKVCFNFKNEGTCKFGATCKFAHIKEE